MILSVSRRTDILAFYSEWFMNRVMSGYVYVRNPFNYNHVSKVKITPENVDCIVFWTKDPRPLMSSLSKLDTLGYKYYFQFTITPYQNDVETNLIDKKEIVNAFIELSTLIGKEKLILRYDPILINEKYSIEFHVKAFKKLCETLCNYTERITFSFIDDYDKVSKNMQGLNIKEISDNDMLIIAKEFKAITNQYNLFLETCAEKIDLNDIGINHGKCIDGDLIESIIGYRITNKNKLDGNRKYCGCMKTIDIGQYDTCIHNCLYCYANINKDRALINHNKHDPNSPILIGEYDDKKITERKDAMSLMVTDNKSSGEQISFFNINHY